MKNFIILLLSLLPMSLATDNVPQGNVSIIEDEIEIEYVDPTVWEQWVFDTDDKVYNMTFNDDGTITYTEQLQPQG